MFKAGALNEIEEPLSTWMEEVAMQLLQLSTNEQNFGEERQFCEKMIALRICEKDIPYIDNSFFSISCSALDSFCHLVGQCARRQIFFV